MIKLKTDILEIEIFKGSQLSEKKWLLNRF